MRRLPIASAVPGSTDHDRLATISIEETIVGLTPAFDDPTETYHESSRLYPGLTDPTLRGHELLETSDEMRISTTRATKRHATAPIIQLPQPDLGGVTLANALARRRSRRCDQSGPIFLGELGTLLGAAYGVSAHLEGSGQSFRTAPSGGALYPLDLYVVPCLVEGVDAALFHYDPLRHCLERLRSVRGVSELEPLTLAPELIRGSAALILMTAMFWRSRFKYGQRAYRFALIEAGHVGQNLSLAATALDLETVPLGGFYDRRVDDFVGADGLNEATLYLFPVARGS